MFTPHGMESPFNDLDIVSKKELIFQGSNNFLPDPIHLRKAYLLASAMWNVLGLSPELLAFMAFAGHSHWQLRQQIIRNKRENIFKAV